MFLNNEQKARSVASSIITKTKEHTNFPRGSYTPEEEKKAEDLLSRIIEEKLNCFDDAERELANGEETGIGV